MSAPVVRKAFILRCIKAFGSSPSSTLGASILASTNGAFDGIIRIGLLVAADILLRRIEKLEACTFAPGHEEEQRRKAVEVRIQYISEERDCIILDAGLDPRAWEAKS